MQKMSSDKMQRKKSFLCFILLLWINQISIVKTHVGLRDLEDETPLRKSGVGDRQSAFRRALHNQLERLTHAELRNEEHDQQRKYVKEHKLQREHDYNDEHEDEHEHNYEHEHESEHEHEQTHEDEHEQVNEHEHEYEQEHEHQHEHEHKEEHEHEHEHKEEHEHQHEHENESDHNDNNNNYDEQEEERQYNPWHDSFQDVYPDGTYTFGHSLPNGVTRYERSFYSEKYKGRVVEGFYTQPRFFGKRTLYELRCYRSDYYNGYRPLGVQYLKRQPIVYRDREPDVDCFNKH